MEVEPAFIAENEMVSRQFVGDEEVTTCSCDANWHGKRATRLRALNGLHHVVQRGRAGKMSAFFPFAILRFEIENKGRCFVALTSGPRGWWVYKGVTVGEGNVAD